MRIQPGLRRTTLRLTNARRWGLRAYSSGMERVPGVSVAWNMRGYDWSFSEPPSDRAVTEFRVVGSPPPGTAPVISAIFAEVSGNRVTRAHAQWADASATASGLGISKSVSIPNGDGIPRYSYLTGMSGSGWRSQYFHWLHARITNLPLSSRELWVDYPNRVRNPSHLLGDSDISGIVAAYQASGTWGGYGNGGVLLTRQHVLTAGHFSPGIGATICCVNMNNDAFTRTITGSALVVGDSTNDLRVSKLDAPFPESITPVLVPDASWVPVFRNEFEYLPLLMVNRFLGESQSWIERASPRVVIRFLQGSFSGSIFRAVLPGAHLQSFARLPEEFVNLYQVTGQASGDFLDFIGWSATDAGYGGHLGYGDSGGPNFIIRNGRPVVFWLNYAAAHGPTPALHLPALQAAIDSLGGDTFMDTIPVT